MSRPPIHTFIGPKDTVPDPALPYCAPRKSLQNGKSRPTCYKSLDKALGAFLLIAGLVVLSGCQGVSAGGTGVQPTGTLSFTANSVSFGSIAAGSSETITVSATNSGTASLTVTAAAFSTSSFSLSSTSLPLTIAAGQSNPVSITFTPVAAGNYTATLALTSNASDSTMDLQLSGAGTGSVALGQLSLNPTSEDFGSVTVGTQQSQTVTLSNIGAANVVISSGSIVGTGFEFSGLSAPLTLAPSQSVNFIVTYSPQTTGSANGTLTFTSDGSNPSLTMALSGTGIAAGALGSNPSSLGFSNVTVGSNKSISETVTNNGGTSVTISNVAISGTGFTLSGITAPVTLTAGQGATFSVKFAPTSTGSVSGDVTITSNATNPTLTIPLSGTGTAATGTLTAAPVTLGVGSVVVGTSGTAQGSLTASGASVTVTAASTNNTVFAVSGLSLPVTIAAGQSVPYTVTFSPQTTGPAGATLTFTSNASPTTTTEALTGTGTAAPTHSVNLSWNASSSQNVSGYNIYRALYSGSCGGYSKINPQLNTTTLYTDSNVTDGDAYCYAATAVNTSQEESGYSNIVSNVQIPAP